MYPTAIDATLAQPYVDDRSDELGANVRIVLARTAEADWRKSDRVRVPAAWVVALAAANADDALAALGWLGVETIVPKTVAQLRYKLAGLAALVARSEPPSLLYFFELEEELMVFEGFLPVQTDRKNDEPRPDEVTAMQALHDGWFEFYSGDVGWSPEEEWQVIGAARADGEKLIGIASKGSGVAGFEPGEPGAPARVLWPDDGRVDIPPRVFHTIDEWIAAALQAARPQR